MCFLDSSSWRRKIWQRIGLLETDVPTNRDARLRGTRLTGLDSRQQRHSRITYKALGDEILEEHRASAADLGSVPDRGLRGSICPQDDLVSRRVKTFP